MLEPGRRDAASAGNSMMVLMSGSLWLPPGTTLQATGVIKNRTWLTAS
jgi:hypothetical protein